MTVWGAPLTGEQMRLLQAAGLPDDVMVKPPYGAAEESINFCYLTNGYHLPADHPAYTLLEKGWLDKPNMRLWFGGDKAPSDWKGGPLLRENGEIEGAFMWSASDHFGYTVIAYIAEAEASYPADGGLKDQVRDPSECQSAFQTIADTVTIAKMTETEARKMIVERVRWVTFPVQMDIAVEALNILGLIKPEPTRAERFWQGKERNSLSQDEAVKALVCEAVKFGQENPE